MKDTYAVILAGGRGTRFWPLSRPGLPKPFLPILDGQSPFESTVLRYAAAGLSKHRILVLSTRDHLPLIRKHWPKKLGRFSLKNFIEEPEGRNTAPAACLAALRIQKKTGPDSVVVVSPSDHAVSRPAAFSKALRRAVRCSRTHDSLVLFAVSPTRPEPGYGYLKVKKQKDALRVERFIEKPGAKRAAILIRQKHLWNSGTFIFRAGVGLDAFRKHRPAMLRAVTRFVQGSKTAYRRASAVSFDYAIMEKTDSVMAVRLECGWSDVGDWRAFAEYIHQGNARSTASTSGTDALFLNSENALVHAPGKQVALVGMQDCAVVVDGDRILVTHLDHAQSVREVGEHWKLPKNKSKRKTRKR